MTRIENENKQPGQLDEMQDEIEHLKKQLKRKQSKKFFSCSSCSVIILIAVVISGAILAALLAKSGLWQIPLFTDYFYHQPVPVYPVKDVTFSEADLINRLKKLASAEALKQKKTSGIEIKFDLSEEEMTALLRGQAQKNESLGQNIEFWQLAVSASQAQLFLKTKSPKNLILTLDFVPEIKDGKINLLVKNFKMGDLALPKFIGRFFIENALTNSLNALLGTVAQAGTLKELNLADHKINIRFLLNSLNL